jgi:GNAT superfamily N-acetyltransferase
MVWLELLYVQVAARGRGIGAKLLGEAECIARAKGFTRIGGEIVECKYTASRQDREGRAKWFQRIGFDVEPQEYGEQDCGEWKIEKSLRQ